jgi:hypothetical protein
VGGWRLRVTADRDADLLCVLEVVREVDGVQIRSGCSSAGLLHGIVDARPAGQRVDPGLSDRSRDVDLDGAALIEETRCQGIVIPWMVGGETGLRRSLGAWVLAVAVEAYPDRGERSADSQQR